jgi:GcrA cell cycle regulator
MQTDWAPEHSQALRDHLAKGLSFAEIAKAINAAFNTDYTRNATIGRARRMGLSGLKRSGDPGRLDDPGRPKSPRKPRPLQLHRKRKCRVARSRPPRPILKRAAALQLRCVGIMPRHLSVVELEARDCRYPYGGDAEGEAITVCGHPRREGSSYCVSHFHLTRGVGSAAERAIGRVLLRLVQAA